MTINKFVSSEVELYVAEGHNRIVSAAARAIQQEKYVAEIVRRHTEATTEFIRTGRAFTDGIPLGTHNPSTAEMEMLAAHTHKTMLLHLEIESFYIFSKTLLDRVAQLMHWWITDTRAARGISMQSHSNVATALQRFAADALLSVPEGMIALAKDLQSKISDYRDHEITHDSKDLFSGTSWFPDGRTKIVKVGVGASAKPARESEDIFELDQLRREYIELALRFLAQNRDKSKLSVFRKGRTGPVDITR